MEPEIQGPIFGEVEASAAGGASVPPADSFVDLSEPVAAKMGPAPVEAFSASGEFLFRVSTKTKHGYAYPVMDIQAGSEDEAWHAFCRANASAESRSEMVIELIGV